MHDIFWHSNCLEKMTLALIQLIVLFILKFREVLLRPLFEYRVIQELFSIWSFLRIYLDHYLKKVPEIR